MIKLRAKQDFTLKDYKKLKNIESKHKEKEKNAVYKDDVFECDEKMAKYLLGDNDLKVVVCELIEVENRNGNNIQKSK